MNIETIYAFACGEIFDDSISLVCKRDDGSLSKEVKFPIQGADCEEHILPFTANAYFGRNSEAVLDPEYRRARVLYPQSFFCNFDPNNYDILERIQTSMGEHASNIRLVRDKLNVYSKNGHFRKHKDTPSNSDMIGTLVVCFPSAFIGGELILYTNPPISFQFDKHSSDRFQWAAFYGDIDHEVTPVEFGNRITITYLIIKNKNIAVANEQSSDIIKNILNNPSILPNGGFLAYSCRYLYSAGAGPVMFKGEDSVVFETFTKLGITPIFETVASYDSSNNYEGFYAICECECKLCGECYEEDMICMTHVNFDKWYGMCLKCSRTIEGNALIKQFDIPSVFYTAPQDFEELDESSSIEEMLRTCGRQLVSNIYWLNEPFRGEMGLSIESSIVYGNYPATREKIYKYAAFLIYINKYELRIEGQYQTDVPAHTL